MAGRLAGKDLALLIGLGAVWGVAFMFISMGLPHFSPILFAAIRYDIAGAILVAIALARKADLIPRGAAQWRAVAFGAGLNIAAYHAFLFWGQRFTTAAVAAVIVGLNPILTTMFSRAVLPGERVDSRGLVGLGIGMLGIVVLASLKPGNLLDARGVGELAALLAITSFALGSPLVRRTGHTMNVWGFTAWTNLGGALILHVISLVLEGGGRAEWNAASITSMAYLTLVASAGGFLVYYHLLARIGPIRANLVSYIAPLFAAAAGFLVLAEPFELRAVLALLLIASGFRLVAGKQEPARMEARR